MPTRLAALAAERRCTVRVAVERTQTVFPGYRFAWLAGLCCGFAFHELSPIVTGALFEVQNLVVIAVDALDEDALGPRFPSAARKMLDP